MKLEILKDRIQLPAQNNVTWIFPVRIENEREVSWKVDSFDLHQWFKEAVGRYPRYEKGDKDVHQDLVENWDRVEPRLRQELVKEVELRMQISVEGLRTSPSEWELVKNLPQEELPPLTEAQHEAVRKMGVSEVDYARSFLAGERTKKTLLLKAQRLARLLQPEIEKRVPKGSIEKVTLKTWEHLFEVQARVGEGVLRFRVDENIVDDLFDSGSKEAEERLWRVIEYAITTGVH